MLNGRVVQRVEMEQVILVLDLAAEAGVGKACAITCQPRLDITMKIMITCVSIEKILSLLELAAGTANTS